MCGGKKKYLTYKAFLNELEGRQYRTDTLPRPVPESGQDMYMLDGQQLAAFAKFTRNVSRLERGYPARKSAKRDRT